MNLTGLMGKETYAIRCVDCRWCFQCPIEQLKVRIRCRACEDK